MNRGSLAPRPEWRQAYIVSTVPTLPAGGAPISMGSSLLPVLMVTGSMTFVPPPPAEVVPFPMMMA